MSLDNFAGALSHLAVAARRVEPKMQSTICAAVATMLAGVDHLDLQYAMAEADKAGFRPEFYPGAIRVYLKD